MERFNLCVPLEACDVLRYCIIWTDRKGDKGKQTTNENTFRSRGQQSSTPHWIGHHFSSWRPVLIVTPQCALLPWAFSAAPCARRGWRRGGGPHFLTGLTRAAFVIDVTKIQSLCWRLHCCLWWRSTLIREKLLGASHGDG